MTTERDKFLEKIKANVKSTDPDAEVILFGSRARGDARKDSDWDILVLTNYPVDFNIENKFIDNLYDIILEEEEVISTFVYSKDMWEQKHRITPFYHNITKEGVLL